MLMLLLIQIVQVLKGAIFFLDPANYISNRIVKDIICSKYRLLKET